MTKDWDGEERRKISQEDHDLLTRIDANLSNFGVNMSAHILADAEAFRVIHLEMEENSKEINSKIGWLQKIVFMGLGVLAFLKLFYK